MTTRWTRPDTGTRAMHTLNQTGRVVWSSIVDGPEVRVERPCVQFAVGADTALADARELLDELVASEFLVEHD